jgi:hypothetical protein
VDEFVHIKKKASKMARKLSLSSQLPAALKVYLKATGTKPTILSHAVFGNGSRLTRVLAGSAGLSVDSWEKVMQYLSDHWPAGIEWPENVIRLPPRQRASRKPKAA